MRVFVTGAGRCGTLTFAEACRAAVPGCTAAHEGSLDKATPWTFPDDHIEVDCRLVWHAHYLIEKYPKAKWVILDRDREAVVQSWAKRGDLRAAFSMLAHAGGPLESARLYVAFVYDYLDRLFPAATALRLTTPVDLDQADAFLWYTGLRGNLDVFTVALTRVHNQGSR